ncbi:MAG: hypothetical protein JO058_04155 [Alphaproteobacteria bacterium]|nr:hypothetical protein [Alphaproteobacteria bacterium]MBV9153922.1 hypothetical protein [Alphaproteobacteria bacterium]MBV9965844.1 hypothetical protein [Alphaproteobacteria bacterium]
MFRYALAVAGAVALISTAAFAEELGTTTKIINHPAGVSKKVIIHRGDEGFGPSNKVVIKKHDMGYGSLVTKKKIIRGEGYGSSMGGRTVIKERPAY